jgi:phosphoribosylaminoimidazole-succinocarboxamide synthase
MSTQRERAEKQRQLKLEAVAQQVADGSLTIRQMTPEERKKYPKPAPRAPRRKRA